MRDSGISSKMVEMVQQENRRQLRLWGVQDHDPFVWLGFATEELGEVAKTISEHRWGSGKSESVVIEAIQTATLLLKIAEMYSDLERSLG